MAAAVLPAPRRPRLERKVVTAVRVVDSRAEGRVIVARVGLPARPVEEAAVTASVTEGHRLHHTGLQAASRKVTGCVT